MPVIFKKYNEHEIMPDVPMPIIDKAFGKPSTFADLSTRKRLPQKSGIYFLWTGSEVTYVGESKNIMKRVSAHAGDSKRGYRKGDYVSYLEFAVDDLKEIEGYYIWKCKPKFNQSKNRTAWHGYKGVNK